MAKYSVKKAFETGSTKKAAEYAIQGSVQHFFGCPSIPSKLAGKLGDVHALLDN